MRYALAALFILLSIPPAPAAHLALIGVTAVPALIRPNLVPNPGFEIADSAGVPTDWLWDRRNTDATCTLDSDIHHSGSHSLKITNSTPFGAQVYGGLWVKTPITLQKGQIYTLSAWTRSDDPGSAWIGGGGGWQIRMAIPPTAGQWQRISMQFTAGEADTSFQLRINTDSANKGLWIDDLKLEAGDTASPALSPGDATAHLEPETPLSEIQGDGPFRVGFIGFVPTAATAVVEVTLGGAGAPLRQQVSLPPGASRLEVQGVASGIDMTPRPLHVRILTDGKETAATQSTVSFISAILLQKRLDQLKSELAPLQTSIHGLQGQDSSYPLVSLTVLENFTGYAQQDLDFRAGETHPFLKRAMTQIDDMDGIAARLRQELERHQRSRQPFPSVPRWTGADRPRVSGPSFLASTAIGAFNVQPTQNPAAILRPVFFTGYGHFGQVRADLEKFASYGTNIIQIEVGPNSVLPAPDVVSDAPMKDLALLLDRAQKARLAVCLLISPHYFPEWMLKAEPKLVKKREGFLQYCLHAPEGQTLLQRFVTALLTPLKDKPALQSICLTNEPVNIEEPCPDGARLFHEWLQRKHGTIADLNGRWGSQYARFEEIPLPNPMEGHPPGPLWMDYVRFNAEFFAGWHKMLADAVHRVAPGLPVHAKAMTWTFFSDGDARDGVDATLFGRMSDINGNDSSDMATYGDSEFGQGWQMNAMAYDLQRSVKDAPVFNSENHLIPDRDTRPVPPEHIRAALWQGAVHGESATTIWIWERSFDPNGDAAGSIMHRPDCAEAVGKVNLDLNRAALEMTALQAAPPQVFVLQSPTAAVWDGGRYTDCLNKLYTALAFTGVKIGFVTEPQLEAGQLPPGGPVFVPDVVHLSRTALTALHQWNGQLIFVGGADLLTRDEYDHPSPSPLNGEALPFQYTRTDWKQIWKGLQDRLSSWKVSPDVTLQDNSGHPVWGVEWRSVRTSRGLIVNLCNERSDTVTFTPMSGGRPMVSNDVLSGETLPRTITLKPLEVRLVVAKER